MSGKIEISRKLAERLLNFTCNEEYDELRALLAAPVVERQPVYMVRAHGSCCWEEINGESLEMCQCQPEEYEVRKFYTSPPAPVAVVLPERRAVSEQSREQAMCANSWNACLDKVKELNQ